MSVQTEIDRIITAVGDAYDAIGAKGGTVPADETVANLGEAIRSIPKGAAEPVLQEKSVTPSTAAQEVTPDSGYDGLSKVSVGAMPTATQATPIITVSSSGLITASATQGAGYVAAGTKSATEQMTTQAAKTITPSTAGQTAVPAGRYTTGAVTVKGDANLVAGNIKSGTTIFGVTGTYEGSGGGSIGEVFRGEVIPTKETTYEELFVTLPNGEQMSISDLWWSSSLDNIWNKIILKGTSVSFSIINTTDSYNSTSKQIKEININFYLNQGNKTRRTWRRCLNDSSYSSMTNTLCFKTGSKYVYYWI